MKEFEVTIPSRPLGVRFAHADRGETVVVHLVLENKLGDRLGLEPGDILIAVNGKTVLDRSSTQALDLFRNQETPYKATFRRYEDEDDSEADSESEQTAFIRGEAKHLMALTGTVQHSKSRSVQLKDWNVFEVVEWLGNYGRALGDEERFSKYMEVFTENQIDGKVLRGLDRVDLAKIGVDEDDVNDLYVGIRELNNIIAVTQDTLQQVRADADDMEPSIQEGDPDDEEEPPEDDEDKEDDEEDNWEAPFLPYMYDAPTVKLSAKTVVKVESSRIVTPYGKKPFALYEIEVIDGDNEWLLSKRYTEFAKFHVEIKKLGVNPRARFPKKGLFKGSTDAKVMKERQTKLTAYLNCLLQDHPEARNSKVLNDFLSPSRTFVVDQ